MKRTKWAIHALLKAWTAVVGGRRWALARAVMLGVLRDARLTRFLHCAELSTLMR